MEKYITDERTGLTYELIGDYYYIAGAEIEDEPIGIWGQRHLRYIREYRKAFYISLLTSGKLNKYLEEIDTEAQNMYLQMIKKLAEDEGCTEELKSSNPMKWVGEMNNIRNRIEEIIYHDLIYFS